MVRGASVAGFDVGCIHVLHTTVQSQRKRMRELDFGSRTCTSVSQSEVGTLLQTSGCFSPSHLGGYAVAQPQSCQ